MLDLSREECIRLLASHGFGRVAVNLGGGPPIIRPVNYAFDEPSQSVVFRTAHGSKLHALLRSADAAFEIDAVDDASRTGWSVIIHGVTDEVTNPSEVRRLDKLGLETWAPGHQAHWVHIRARIISGRRIVLGSMASPMSFSADQARAIGERVGIDWQTSRFDVEQFRMGLAVELEHGRRGPATNVTDDDELTTGKIAWAHLNEFPDYYTRLAKMEADAEQYWAERGADDAP